METTPQMANLKKKIEASELEDPVDSLLDLIKLAEPYFAFRNI